MERLHALRRPAVLLWLTGLALCAIVVSRAQFTAAVSYTHLTLPTKEDECRSRWSPYH